MNIKKIKSAEKQFLKKYPGGFNHPYFSDIEKKHKMGKMVELTQSSFSKSSFKKNEEIADNFRKIIGRSSMVSVFEKAKFRDFIKERTIEDKKKLSSGLEKFLYSSQEKGFALILEVLEKGKLGKWPLMTAIPAYFSPDTEVFVKPTTAKGVIQVFELENLVYKPKPTWEFYSEYRKQINEMKKHVNKSLSPSNAAFSGFLMMVLNNY